MQRRARARRGACGRACGCSGRRRKDAADRRQPRRRIERAESLAAGRTPRRARPAGGGSNHSSVCGSPPHASTSRTVDGEIDASRSRARDAGAADRARPTDARTRPACTRPARPARWSAESCDTRSVSRLSMPRSASYRATLCRPVSTTHVTSGTVSVVSARLVARTMRVPPVGLQRRVLLVGSRARRAAAAPQRRVRRSARQLIRGSSNLRRARQEARGRRRRRRRPPAPTACLHRDAGRVRDVERKLPAGHVDHRTVAEVTRDARGIDRRGHHDQPEVGARTPGLARERQPDVGVDAALVELVDHDRPQTRRQADPAAGARSGCLRSRPAASWPR